MDAATAERINNLAKNLKELHIASSMEDAFEKARDIILETDNSGKPLKALYQDEGLLQETQELAKEEAKEMKEVSQVVEALNEFKDAQTKDEENSVELTHEASKAADTISKEQSELARIRAEIEQAKKALEEAKKSTESFQRQIPPMADVAKPQRKQLTEEEKKKSDLSSIFNFGRR